MDIVVSNTPNSLDRKRKDNGPKALEVYFDELAQSKPREAIDLVNDDNLHFASLFVLRSKLMDPSVNNNLNLRNTVALKIINEILTGERDISVMERISSDYTQIIHSTLKWMFETGSIDDGLSNQYDEVLDIAAILLTKLYNEQKIIPTIVDMIFNRNRKDYFIHDLVWAFYESRDPYSLIMIANRLLSSDEKDIQLANKLLSFVPAIAKDDNANNQKKYISFLDWIEENSLFLYFTGQSLQQTNKPMPYAVDLEAKYLCKYISVDTGKTLKPMTEREHGLLDEFRRLNLDTKIFLSSFSNMMHYRDPAWWDSWINQSITEQVKIAKSMIGGEQ